METLINILNIILLSGSAGDLRVMHLVLIGLVAIVVSLAVVSLSDSGGSIYDKRR